MSLVFLGVGIFRLEKRMRTISETGDWKPVYMSNKFSLYIIVLIFMGINALMIVVTAMPKAPGAIPRYYWPVTVFACVVAGAVYWCGLKSLQMTFGGEKTLGARIGLEVNVYNEGDEDIPEHMKSGMADAKFDGSRRRVSYKVSLYHFEAFIGCGSQDLGLWSC